MSMLSHFQVTIKGERRLFFPPSGGYRKITAAPTNQVSKSML
jgi:hypothetical protein